MTPRLVRVLLADDDELIRLTMAAVCSAIAGITLAGEATNGEEALEQFHKLRPDVVLLDINMPKISGIEALAKLKATDPDVAVVMLTANSDAATVHQCLLAGAAGYILKSDSPDVIRATIRDVCFKKLQNIVGAG